MTIEYCGAARWPSFLGSDLCQKKDWLRILIQLADALQKKPNKVKAYAQNLAEGIKAINLVENQSNLDLFNADALAGAVKDWSRYFDTFWGGYKCAPKFMMPVNLNFLMHYGTVQKDERILEYVHTTLTKMAWGGTFDHLGWGVLQIFRRYEMACVPFRKNAI